MFPMTPVASFPSQAQTGPRIHVVPEKDFGHLKCKAYEGRKLARMLIRNTNVSTLFKVSARDRALLRRPLPNSTLCNAREVREVLISYISALDSAYFFGAVQKRLGKLIVKDRQAGDGRGHGKYHAAGGSGYVTIYRKPSSTWETYLSSLVHEMLHCFLDMYTCVCSQCLKNGNSLPRKYTTGHGENWSNSMLFISAAMNRDLHWQSDVGLQGSINNEMQRTGWKPRYRQIYRWGLTGWLPDPVLQEVLEEDYSDVEEWVEAKDQRRRDKARGCMTSCLRGVSIAAKAVISYFDTR